MSQRLHKKSEVKNKLKKTTMYIVNTTFVVQPSVHGAWYEFFTEKVIGHVNELGFSVLAFTRILHEQSDGHYSYSLQVEVDEIGDVQRYRELVVGQYVDMARKLYGEQALHFTSVLKRVI